MPREMKDSGISWVGDIPKDWHVNKIKYVTHSRTTKYKLSDVGRYIGLENVESFSGRFVEKNSEYEDGYYDGCEQGDLLYGKLRPNLAKVLLSPYKACCTGEFEVIAQAEVGKKYLQYYMLTDGFTQTVTASTYGAKMPRASWDYIKNIGIVYPNVTEREKIVSFLDSKCTEIDALSADIQKQIEKLEEYKRSIITEAVTKGLDPNAKMKDSGIEWIGQIPAKWSLNRVANVFAERNEPGNEGLPFLSVSINSGISDKELSQEDLTRQFVRADAVKNKRVYPGDIVYNMMRAWQGAIGAVRTSGMVSAAYVTAKPIKEIDTRYYEYLFRTPAAIQEMNKYSYGIMDFRKRLYWSYFRNITLCVPPLAEQTAIADYADKITQEVDSLIRTKEMQLASLEEYKKSVIYEYVTGKKEVPDAKA